MSLPPASSEQAAIVRAVVQDGHNVSVSAVAGSGKTTCIMHVGRALQEQGEDRRLLLLTYNAALKDESRERAARLGLASTVEVHSYHAMCVKYYSELAYVDTAMEAALKAPGVVLRECLPKYTVVVIDEAQDMTLLYYTLLVRVLSDTARLYDGHIPRFLVVGDVRQAIFGFKGADERFLSRCRDLPGFFNGRHWDALPLRVTYRLTRNMVSFINDCMLGGEGVFLPAPTALRGAAVTYRVGCPFRQAELVGEEIYNLISRAHNPVRPDDIFILAYSAKSVGGAGADDESFYVQEGEGAGEQGKGGGPRVRQPGKLTPLKVLANALQRRGVQLYIKPSDSDTPLDKRHSVGKVAITTMHSTKGMERPYVFVMGFAEAFFKYCDSMSDPTVCPNLLYVAASRASRALTLLGEERVGEHVPFLNVRELEELRTTGQVRYHTASKFEMGDAPAPPSPPRPSKIRFKAFAASGLTDHVPGKLLNRVKALVEWECTRRASKVSRVSGSVDTSAYTRIGRPTSEPVSHLNGLAIPAMLEVECLRREAALAAAAAAAGEEEKEACTAAPAVPSTADVEADLSLAGRARPAPLKKDPVHRKSTMLTALLQAATPAGLPDSGVVLMPCLAAQLHAYVEERGGGDPTTTAHFLELAALYVAGVPPSTGGYTSMYSQLAPTRFSWLSEEDAELFLSRLRTCVLGEEGGEEEGERGEGSSGHEGPPPPPLPQSITFEHPLEERFDWVGENGMYDVLIQGMADVVTQDCLWEVKCTQTLKGEHYIQLAVYAWLYYRGSGAGGAPRPPRAFRLTNVLTGEVWEMQQPWLKEGAGGGALTAHPLDLVLQLLLSWNFRGDVRPTDDEWLAQVYAAHGLPPPPRGGAAQLGSSSSSSDDSSRSSDGSSTGMDEREDPPSTPERARGGGGAVVRGPHSSPPRMRTQEAITSHLCAVVPAALSFRTAMGRFGREWDMPFNTPAPCPSPDPRGEGRGGKRARLEPATEDGQGGTAVRGGVTEGGQADPVDTALVPPPRTRPRLEDDASHA